MERMEHLVWGSVVVRRQPPIRLSVCRAPTTAEAEGCASGPFGCDGTLEGCPYCLHRFCAYHVRWHRDSLPVPPDAWRRTLQSVWAEAKRIADVPFSGVLFDPPHQLRQRGSIEIGGIPVSRLPPWRIWYCRTPSTGYVDAECGHGAKTCQGQGATCDRCGFSYCKRHLPTHARNLVLPEYVIAPILEGYRRQLDALVQPGAPRRGIKVPSPPFKVVA